MSRLKSKSTPGTSIVVAVILMFFELGCGGAGSSTNVPPTPDFTLNAVPTASSVSDGNAISVALSATAVDGFHSPISVQVTGLPNGVSISPSSITLSPGASLQVNLLAATNAPASSGTIIFTGTSGSLAQSASFQIAVTALLSNQPPSRTRYLRTGAVSIPSNGLIYNPVSNQFFATDTPSGQVTVVDATTEKKVGSINVPGASALDDTPDHKTLYVSTTIGDIYAIDISSLKVTKRYLSSQIGPYGYHAISVLVLADMRLALLGEAGGIPSIDGSTSFSIWSPTDNSITIYGSAASGVPTVPDCVGNIGGFERTADRTKVIVGSIEGSAICEVDETTGQMNVATAISEFSTSGIFTSPDGNYIALRHGGLVQGTAPPNQVDLYDAHTLALISQFNVSGDDAQIDSFMFSADSKTLFAPSDIFVYAYDIASQKVVAWGPNISVGPYYQTPFYQAVDQTGLLVGSTEEGLVFFDSAAMRTGPVGAPMFELGFPAPATGPVTGGTQVQLFSPPATGNQAVVYFGGQAGTFNSRSGNNVTMTTPPGLPGPVDVYDYTADGGLGVLPEAFSYGPSIVRVTTDATTAEGGATGIVFGYGFGYTTAKVSNPIPADLQVSVAGQAAPVLEYFPDAYGFGSPPTPMEAMFFKIPAHSVGVADVSITTGSGTVTSSGALTYFAMPQRFPSPGATLVQGIYDPHHDLYYFTDTNKIQVFSKSQGAWLTPISIPAPSGLTQRLWALALSPDGTKLAISDIVANVIYLLDPSSPGSVQTFAVNGHPAGLAVSDAGMVYSTVVGARYFRLDTKSGAIFDYDIYGPGLSDTSTIPPTSLDSYLRNSISSDNSRVFFNNYGNVFSIATASDTVNPASTGPGCCYGDYDLTLSKDQTRLEATSYLYDFNLNAESLYSPTDIELQGLYYLYGAKLSPDGNLLFQPTTNGIDVLDGRFGTLRTRIALPFALSANYDALVSDGKDNVLVAITGTGDEIAVVDLTSLPDPPALSYASAASTQASSFTVFKRESKTQSAAGSSLSGSSVQRHFTRAVLTR